MDTVEKKKDDNPVPVQVFQTVHTNTNCVFAL